MSNDKLKTSEMWERECPYKILDPDGWDRHGDYEYSFYQEKITKKEFDKRLAQSTVIGKEKFDAQ